MPTTTLSLDAGDAAIILKQDGTFETSFPELTSEVIPENVVMGAALAYALRNADMCERIRSFFHDVCQQIRRK